MLCIPTITTILHVHTCNTCRPCPLKKDSTLRVHINHAMAARDHATQTQTQGARVLSPLVGQISDVGSTRRTLAALFETAEQISNSNMDLATYALQEGQTGHPRSWRL